MRPRPTDEEFAELARKRHEAVNESIARICKEQGWDLANTHVHCSHSSICYCDCPDGPCQHVWNGPEEVGDNYSSVTCSRCGMSAISHDMRYGP